MHNVLEDSSPLEGGGVRGEIFPIFCSCCSDIKYSLFSLAISTHSGFLRYIISMVHEILLHSVTYDHEMSMDDICLIFQIKFSLCFLHFSLSYKVGKDMFFLEEDLM